MMMGNQLNVMTQAPYDEDKANLPNGIYVMRIYTKLQDGSQSMAVVICNMAAYLICLAVGRVIACIMAAKKCETATLCRFALPCTFY